MNNSVVNSKVNPGLKENIKHGTFHYHIGIYNETQTPDSNIVQYLHWHDEYEIFVIKEGGCEISLNNTYTTIFKGDMVLIPSGLIHGALNIPHIDCNFRAFVFGKDFVDSLTNDKPNMILKSLFDKSSNMPIIIDGSLCDEIQKEAYSITESIIEINQKRTPGYELMTKAKLLELLCLFWDYSLNSKERKYKTLTSETNFKKALLYINENYAKQITLEDLASYANLSKSQIDRVFMNNMGMPPMKYITQLRINKSLRMLLDSDYPISEIALNVGFNDFSYFSKCFKETIHMSPRDYRKHKRLKTTET